MVTETHRSPKATGYTGPAGNTWVMSAWWGCWSVKVCDSHGFPHEVKTCDSRPEAEALAVQLAGGPTAERLAA